MWPDDTDDDSKPQSQLTYQFWTAFARVTAAPLATPRVDGIGAADIVDTGNNLSVTANGLEVAAQVATSDPRVLSVASFTRAQGLAFVVAIDTQNTTQGVDIGFGPNANAIHLGASLSIGIRASSSATFLTGLAFGAAANRLAIVQQSAGQYYFATPAGGTLSLMFVDIVAVASSVVGWRAQGGGTGVLYFRSMATRTLTGAFATLDGVATLNQASPTTGTAYTGDADGVFVLQFALPGSPGAGDKAELRYRVLDANNYMVAAARWNGAAWDFFLDSVVAGVATNRITTLGISASTIALEVRAVGSLHDCWTLLAATWTKRGGTITDANQAAQTGMNATFVSATVSALKSYPYQSALYNVLA